MLTNALVTHWSFSGAWSGLLFLTAAIIYVNNTDLLIVAKCRDVSLDDFVDQTQSSIMDWGLIVEATGRYIKAVKCFWYMMAWKWNESVPSLCSLHELPHYQLIIPQKSLPPVPIPRHDVTHCEETLGIFACPAGEFGYYIDCKREAGKLWVERLRQNRCAPADGWVGFRYALIPKMTYGFTTITPDLDKLEDSFQRLYQNVLSPFCLNMNIWKFYQMAPKQVQGLGMPNPRILMLSQMLHLLQSRWDQPTMIG